MSMSLPRSSRVRRACVALLLCLPPLSVHAAEPELDFAPTREYLRARMQERDVPAMSVAVAKDGRLLWAEGFGMADRERGIAADADTMYSLASVTKTFTAVALMTLVQEGCIALDDPINDHLGEARLHSWVDDADAATLRHVANHTSGLGTAEQFFYGESERALIPPMAQSIQRYGHLYRRAGETHEYNNFGYGLLGHVVERISGQPYGDYLRTRVFAPLGMRHSAIDLAAGLERHAAARYGGKREPIPFYGFAEPGAAAMYASARDLARFGSFFLGHLQPGQREILDARHRAAMVEGAFRTDPHAAYGIGLEVIDDGGYRWYEHGGSMSGVSASLTMVPSEGLVVAVLGNVSGAPVAQVRERIFQQMLPGWRAEAGSTAAAAPVAAQSTPPGTAPIEWRGDWSGILHTYEGPVPARLRVLDDGRALFRLGDQLWSLLDKVEVEDGRLRGYTLSQVPTVDAQRRRHALRVDLRQRGDALAGEAMAWSGPKGPAGVLDPYFVFALNHWLELRRANAGDEG